MESIINNPKPSISVIGGGSWAIALIRVLTNNHHRLTWYMRDKAAVAHILKYHHHSTYLRPVHLNPEKFTLTNDINQAVCASDILIFVIPSVYFLGEMSKLTVSLENKIIISAIKGFTPGDNLTIAEYFHSIHKIPFDNIGVISGPCHAEEVSMERLSYITISSKYMEVSDYLCSLFANKYIHAIPGDDIYGVEYSAALKNIYALTAGICVGLGYGDNFMAVYTTGAYNELVTFLNASHPSPTRVPSKSAYLGDLLVTCYSPFSRNRAFGGMIGKGYPVETALLEMNQVAEGYYATKAIHEINKKYKISMPIAETAYAILYKQKEAAQAVSNLLDKLQ